MLKKWRLETNKKKHMLQKVVIIQESKFLLVRCANFGLLSYYRKLWETNNDNCCSRKFTFEFWFVSFGCISAILHMNNPVSVWSVQVGAVWVYQRLKTTTNWWTLGRTFAFEEEILFHQNNASYRKSIKTIDWNYFRIYHILEI